MRRRAWVSAVLATGLIAVIAPAHAATVDVNIAGFQYLPSGKVTASPLAATTVGTPVRAPLVRPGDALRWTNRDPVVHSVTYLSGPKTWASKTVAPLTGTATLSITSTFPVGTYAYTCVFHPTMRGSFKRIAGVTIEVNVVNNQYVPSRKLTSPVTTDIPDGTPLSTPQVLPGDKIRWRNRDSTPHTVTYLSGPASWASKSLPANGTTTLSIPATFPVGTYVYRCLIHPAMRGAFKRV